VVEQFSARTTHYSLLTAKAPKAPGREFSPTPCRAERPGALGSTLYATGFALVSLHLLRKSAQRGAALLPQGMIGTVDVEFCGEPSISLSE
jgi:hypothetical protein